MKGGFNYGLLFMLGGVAFIVIVGEIVLWHSRRANRNASRSATDESVTASR